MKEFWQRLDILYWW